MIGPDNEFMQYRMDDPHRGRRWALGQVSKANVPQSGPEKPARVCGGVDAESEWDGATTYSSYATSSTAPAATTVVPGSKTMRHDRDGIGRSIVSVRRTPWLRVGPVID